MLRQIIAGIRLPGKRVGESGAVINIGRSKAAPRQSNIAADIQSVALIVIEGPRSRERKIGQTSGDCAAGLRDLVRIGEMKLRRDAQSAASAG